jgi:MFS family permease
MSPRATRAYALAVFARYRTVLAAPGARRLYATGVLARLPQGMSTLSVLLLVHHVTRSYALAGLATGVGALFTAVAGPPQGRLVDRLGRSRVLAPCALAQAALFVALVLAARSRAPDAALVVIAGAIGAAQPAIAPSVRALLGILLTDDDVRESAYALESVIQELIFIIGPLLVGVVITIGSPSLALLLCAVVIVLGTGLFVSTPASRVAREPVPRVHGGLLRSHPKLRALLAPVALMGVSIGATDVGLPSLALHAGSRASLAPLLAMWSLGSMVGGLVYGSRRWRGSLPQRYRGLLAVAVVCALPLVFARSIPAGLAGSLLTGLTVAPVFSCQYALVGRVVSDGTQTEAFTWVSAALVTGIAGGSTLAGALIGAWGVSGPFLLTCAALAVAAITATGAGVITPVAG